MPSVVFFLYMYFLCFVFVLGL